MSDPLVLLDRIDAALAEMRRSVPADFLADSSGGMLLALAESRAKVCRDALRWKIPKRRHSAELEISTWAKAWRLDE